MLMAAHCMGTSAGAVMDPPSIAQLVDSLADLIRRMRSEKQAAKNIARGFTAIELMVSIAIMGILMALATPSFARLITRWRVLETVEKMKSTLYFARSEAIKRGGRIGVQKQAASAKSGCTLAATNEEWSCGWFVFVDSDGNGKWKTGETILQTVTPSADINVIHKGGGAHIVVDAYGKMDGMNAKGFIVAPEPEGIASSSTRGLCMSSGGRIRIIEDVPCQ